MRQYLSVRFSILALLLGMFCSQAWADRNVEESQNDSDLDEDTRSVLEKIKRPVTTPPEVWEEILMRYRIKMGRNAQVLFFGKVVDQNMMPIEGVRVSGFVLSFDNAYLENLIPGTSDQKVNEWSIITGKNGGFTVRGLRGLSLHIKKLEKDGYVAPVYGEYFRISGKHFRKDLYNPEADQPVVFKMWPKDIAEHSAELIQKEIRMSCLTDGREYRIDLANGSFVTNTEDIFDVSVKITSASHNSDVEPKYDWSFSLSTPDGGLISTDDLHPYEAPEGGYMSPFVSKHSSADKVWSRSEHRRFYVRSRGGTLYAIIDLTIYAYRDGKSLVRIDSVANVRGSRNLMTLR